MSKFRDSIIHFSGIALYQNLGIVLYQKTGNTYRVWFRAIKVANRNKLAFVSIGCD